MDLKVLNDTAWKTGTSPFFQGGSAIFVNFTAGPLIVQGSDDNGVTDAYTTFVTVPAGGMIEGSNLPLWIKVSTAATVYVLA